MIRSLRYVLLALLAIVLLTIAIANRMTVPVNLLPPDMAAFLGRDLDVQMPLFMVIFGGIVAGLLIGFVWEWVREYKHRSTASTKSREVARLERELAVLRDEKQGPQDDILALLDRPKAR
jgi:lipopolysaccharide assembly protein A